MAALAPYQQFWVIFLGRLIFGTTISIGISMYMTMMQLAVPPEKQGRIFSFDNFISTAITPVSMLIAGSMVEWVGIVPVFVACWLIGIAVNIAIALTGVMKIKYNTSDKKVQEQESEKIVETPTSTLPQYEGPQEVPTEG